MQTPLRDDARAVSEIVGALLLVVIVSSAAFGFGLFLHGQAKATQAQKEVELAKQLEQLAVQGIDPVDEDFAADCSPAGADGSWNALSFRVASGHLKSSRIAMLRLNGEVVQHVMVGAQAYDFGLPIDDPAYAPLDVGARQQTTLTLANVATDPSLFIGPCGSAQPFSLFGGPPATAPFAASDPILLEIVTDLGNTFSRVFQPPTAVIIVQQRGSGATSYILDGSHSDTPNGQGFLTRYDWTVEKVSGTCPDPVPNPTTHVGRIVLAPSIDVDCTFQLTLTVTDNFGMEGTAAFTLDLEP